MKTIVIGIAGGSGSGKTTLVNRVIQKLPEDIILFFQHDAYYYDLSKMPESDPARINYDHPDSLETDLCVEHLKALKRWEPIDQPIYDYSTHRRKAETRRLEPRSVIFVEGILVLAEKTLREEIDVKVYVDADQDICLLRRIERDVTTRGRTIQSVRDQYFSTVRPMFEKFVAPSKQYADIIIPHGGENEVAQNILLGYLKNELSDREFGKFTKT